MNKVNWSQVVVFGLVALVAFILGASLLVYGWGSGADRGSMMGPGMMGDWGFAPFGWFFMLLWILLPLGLLVLLGLGIVWLFRQMSGGSPSGTARTGGSAQSSAGRTCSNCGRPVQADWQLCPYCGQELMQEEAPRRQDHAGG